MPNDPVTTTTDSAVGGGTPITEPTGPAHDEGTTPAGLAGFSRSGLKPGDVGYQGPVNNDPPAPGTGSEPAATDEETALVEESKPAPGDLGATHVIVPHETVSTLRRLMSDVGRGTEGALEKLRDVFNRVF